jgi:hypothetical protein
MILFAPVCRNPAVHPCVLMQPSSTPAYPRWDPYPYHNHHALQKTLSHPLLPSSPLLTSPQTAFRARRCEGVLSRAALSEDTLAQALEALKLDLEAAGHSPAYGSQDFRMQLTR